MTTNERFLSVLHRITSCGHRQHNDLERAH